MPERGDRIGAVCGYQGVQRHRRGAHDVPEGGRGIPRVGRRHPPLLQLRAGGGAGGSDGGTYWARWPNGVYHAPACGRARSALVPAQRWSDTGEAAGMKWIHCGYEGARHGHCQPLPLTCYLPGAAIRPHQDS